MNIASLVMGAGAGVLVLGLVGLIAQAAVDRKEKKARDKAVNETAWANWREGVMRRMDGVADRITTLERDSVILNKRADCALACVDGALDVHEHTFHAPKGGKK